jgi:hypothetical protein
MVKGKRARRGKVVRYLVCCSDPRRHNDWVVCRRVNRAAAKRRADMLNEEAMGKRGDRHPMRVPLYYVVREAVAPGRSQRAAEEGGAS